MKTILIFVWIWGAMVAMAFWEAYVEGRNAWDKGKLGWKVRLGPGLVLTGYHFYLFVIMWPLLLTLPFVMYGWDARLFGIVLSAFVSGTVLEDFMWYVVNPAVKISELHTNFAAYYPRVPVGKWKIPLGYFIGVGIAVLSWYFLWR
jgi:hypothetical protein